MWNVFKRKSELEIQELELERATKRAESQSEVLEKLKERLDVEVQIARDRIECDLLRSRLKNPMAELKQREGTQKKESSQVRRR